MAFYKMLMLLENDKKGPSGWLSPSGRLYESEKYMFDHLGIISDQYGKKAYFQGIF